MKRMVDAKDLTDVEAEAVAQAVDIYRATPTAPLSFRAVPMRDEAGKLCEVQFFVDSDAPPLAVIRVTDDGAVAPMGDLT